MGDLTVIEHASEDDALDGANRFGGNDAHPNSLARQITARREAEVESLRQQLAGAVGALERISAHAEEEIGRGGHTVRARWVAVVARRALGQPGGR